MKKLVLLLLVFIPIFAVSQNTIEYNYKTSTKSGSELDDIVKRKIYQKDNAIIIEKYFKDLGMDLSLIIDKKDESKQLKLTPRTDNAPWYYCHDIEGDNYILIGLNTNKVELYCLYSELEIIKYTFE